MFTTYRRPSGDPDKDVIDHMMQVKLAYKDQLTHILQQVRSSCCQSFLTMDGLSTPFTLLKFMHHSYLICNNFLEFPYHFSSDSICSPWEMSDIPKISY